MKKFFMKDTDDEVKFGDMIELDCTKEMDNGHTCHHYLTCKFIPELVETLLEEDIIEVKEVNETPKKDALINFTDDCCPQIEELINLYKSLDKKIDMLHSDLNQIKNFLILNCKKPSTNAKKPTGK